MLLSVIIPTFNRNDILRGTLQRLTNELSGIAYEVLVVNDSEQPVEMEFPNTRIVRNPAKGAAAARNFGAGIAAGEILLFLDDDIVVTRTAIDKLLDHTRAGRQQLWFSNWRYPDELLAEMDKTAFGRFLHQIRYHELKGWLSPDDWKSDSEPFRLTGVASYCLMIRKKDFEALGGYDQSFLFAGAEDYDISRRLVNAGFSFWLDPSIWVFHNEADRLQLKNWMHRRRTGAFTHRHAVEKGYEAMKINYSPAKKLLLNSIFASQPLVKAAAGLVASRRTQRGYNLFMKALIAANIFRGYHADYRNQQK